MLFLETPPTQRAVPRASRVHALGGHLRKLEATQLPMLAKRGAPTTMCDLQHGEWLPIEDEAGVRACPGLRDAGDRRCSNSIPLLQFRPRRCTEQQWPALTVHNVERALGGRTLRFIGDSVTSDHYHHLTACLMNCNASHPRRQWFMRFADSKNKNAWVRALVQAGYSTGDANAAIRHMGANIGKDGYKGGCALGSGHVDYRRLNLLNNPAAPNVTRAIFHALLYLSSRPVTSSDVVVINFSLHGSLATRGVLRRQMAIVLDWWAEQRRAGRAPMLLWRESSPQHWAGPFGAFRSFADGDGLSEQCTAHAHAQAAFARHSYDANVSADIHEAAHDWAQVLPVFTATWPRVDDHPLARVGALGGKGWREEARLANHSYMDCNHFCVPGSVNRFWNQALLSWLAGHPPR